MKKILCVLLSLAMLPAAALAESPEDGESEQIEAILRGMTLEEKVGQMMTASFRVWKEIPPEGSDAAQAGPAVNITELNDEIHACIEKYHFGGVLLFGENCRDAAQTLRLVADMQAANQAGGGLPLLVSIDQEGGMITRLGYGTTGPGNMALAATGEPENAATMAGIHGEELRLLGIHADFAPVMDVNSNPNNPVIGVRSFSDDPAVTAAYGCAYLTGLHSAGVMAALKHFPGHGNTDTDSHTGFPRIDSTCEELQACELIPFRAAIEAGADMVMTAHIQYPQIEKETCLSASTGREIYLPATMSRVILENILRGDLGFEGVIVSDALDMAAVADNFTAEEIIRRTINAGVDLLLLPSVRDTAGFGKVQEMMDTAVRLVREGAVDEARVDASVRRILRLKQKYSLLEQRDFTVTDEQVRAALDGVGSAANRAAAEAIARKALTLVKNENGAFPVTMREGEKALILFADSCASRAGTGELAARTLRENSALPEGAEITVMTNTRDNGDECLQTAARADHAILVNRVYNAACIDPATDDGFSTAVFDRIIAARRENGKQTIVVSCQLPYDAARFPDADAMLLTYASSAMRTVPPEAGIGSAYAPNLPAALCACFGLGEASGQLPVNLPTVDAQYALARDILYAERSVEAPAR